VSGVGVQLHRHLLLLWSVLFIQVFSILLEIS